MSDLDIRPAGRKDVPAIVALLRDDHLGATREGTPTDPAYLEAFDAIVQDPHQFLVVGVRDGSVVGTLQLTIVPGLSRMGSRRAFIEAVRVRSDLRGGGYGKALIEWAVDKARAEGCVMVQLTSDQSRVDAHRFYARLGFVQSHVGFKLAL